VAVHRSRCQVSEGTFLRYETICRNHLRPFFGRLRMRNLTRFTLRAFKSAKIEEGLNLRTRGCHARCAQRAAKPGRERRVTTRQSSCLGQEDRYTQESYRLGGEHTRECSILMKQ
jgi:hypothetical protein